MSQFVKNSSGQWFMKTETGTIPITDSSTLRSLQLGLYPSEATSTIAPQVPAVPQVATAAAPLPRITTSSAAPPPQQDTQASDPLTKFNLAILGMLEKAQGVDSQNDFSQQRALQRKAIDRTAAPTPEELKILSPAQQSALRTGSVEALEPEIDAVSAKIKASDQRLSNFEQMLGTIKDLGQDMLKNVAPSKEIIEGYKAMIRAGGQPTAIPDEVRNKVLSQLSPEDWKVWGAENRKGALGGSGDGSTAGERETTAKAEFFGRARKDLDSSTRGTDQGIDPVVYRRWRDDYESKFGEVEGFYKNFPIKGYIAPKNRRGDLRVI